MVSAYESRCADAARQAQMYLVVQNVPAVNNEKRKFKNLSVVISMTDLL
jgi:hypothetical protein